MTPWDWVLTVLFAATGVWCAFDLVRTRSRSRRADGALTTHAIVDVNHFVMSVAMILMIWVPMIDAATWAQVIIFALFLVALLPGLFTSPSRTEKVSLAGHVALNAAMVWMLLAMPLLMAGMHDAGGGHEGHHHGGGNEAMIMSTPPWADVVNVLFIALSAAAAAWWIVVLLRSRGRHLHDLCYSAMGLGMALMLFVMNV